jgi:hypothetical protein
MTEEQRYRQVEIAQIKVRQHYKRLKSLAEQREAASRAGHMARANGLTVTYEQRLRAYLPLLDRLLDAHHALAASLLVAGDDMGLMNLRQAILHYEQERDQTSETLRGIAEHKVVIAI